MDLVLPNLGLTVYNRYDLLKRFFESLDPEVSIPSISVVINSKKDRNEEVIQYISSKWTQTEWIYAGYNLGISASWNLIIKKYLIENEHAFVSQDDVMFKDGALKKAAEYYQQNKDADYTGFFGYGFFAVSRKCIREVGFFDENFYPAYSEDADYNRRLNLTPGLKIRNCPVPVVHGDEVHPNGCTTKTVPGGRKKIHMSTTRMLNKWGGYPPNAQFSHPFNNPALSHKDWVLDIDVLINQQYE